MYRFVSSVEGRNQKSQLNFFGASGTTELCCQTISKVSALVAPVTDRAVAPEFTSR